MKGRVKKVPIAVNYNELFVDTNKYEDNLSNNKKAQNNLDDFLDIVKKNEEFNNLQDNKKNINEESNVDYPIKHNSSLPKTKQDLLFFDEPELKFNLKNCTNEIDFNLEFLKNTKTYKNLVEIKNDESHTQPKQEIIKDNESERIINKLKNSGAFKIDVTNSRKESTK